MSLARSLFSFLHRSTQPAPTAPPSTSVVEQYFYDLVAEAPTGVKIATVYRCIKLLSDGVAQMPLLYKRRSGEVFIENESSVLNYLLNVQPNEWTNAYDLKAQMITQLLMDGNAYIVVEYSKEKSDFAALKLCGRGTVQHDTDKDLYTINDKKNRIDGVYTEAEVIHIKGPSLYDMKTGVSVLGLASSALDIAGAGDAETLKRFKRGGNPRGILKNAMTGRGLDGYDGAELDKLGDNLCRQIESGKSVIVSAGETSFDQWSMTSADMEFLASRKFSVREICRFFGVPPTFAFDDSSNNYKSAEMARVDFYSNTINPLLLMIESEFNRKLIGQESWKRRRIEFDRSGVYALDLDSKARYYGQMIGTGAMTVNDVRRLENQPFVDGGDRVFISANLRGIDEMAQNPQPNNNENEQ